VPLADFFPFVQYRHSSLLVTLVDDLGGPRCAHALSRILDSQHSEWSYSSGGMC
jgi:hypothetical protein